MAKGKQASSELDHWNKAILALQNSSDGRSLGVLWGAMVEDAVDRLIQLRLVQGKAAKALIDGYMSPLGTFSAKINLAHAVGLLTDAEAQRADKIKEMRNLCAHDFEASFDKGPLRDKMAAVDIPGRTGLENESQLTRFRILAMDLTSTLWNRRLDVERIVFDF